jgi:PAS domain-containing protein
MQFEETQVTQQQQDTFSSRLTRLMQDRGESHAEIGRVVGVSGQAVGKWARGGNIEYDNLRSLAEHFDVNWIWLRYGDDAMQSFTERRVGSQARRAVIKDIIENEQRMRLALGAAQIGTWDLDLLADQLVLSSEARALLGAEDLKEGRGARNDLLKYVADADRPRLQELLEQALQNKVDRFDFTHRLAHGNTQVRQRGQVIKDELGRPVRVVGLVNHS